MSRFPIIDHDRYDYDNGLGRDVMGETSVDILDATSDKWASLPVRYVFTTAGVCIEIGPYTLIPEDAEKLRAALHGYLDEYIEAVAKSRRMVT